MSSMSLPLLPRFCQSATLSPTKTTASSRAPRQSPWPRILFSGGQLLNPHYTDRDLRYLRGEAIRPQTHCMEAEME